MEYGLRVLTSRLFIPFRTKLIFNSKFSTHLETKKVSPVISKKHKDVLESAKWELGIKTWEDWYNIKPADLANITNVGFLKSYENFADAIIQCYPEHPWNFYKFSSLTHSFWKDKNKQKEFFEYAAKQLSIYKMEDWYAVKEEDIEKIGGKNILALYSNSLQKALISLFPQQKWKLWKFNKVSEGFWSDKKNVRTFLEDIGQNNNFKTMKDYYKISHKIIVENGGNSLFYHYGSVADIVKTAFPEYNFNTWEFDNVPSNFWAEHKNRRDYLEWLGKLMGFKKMEDWYSITLADILENGGRGILRYYPSYKDAIMAAFNEYPWKSWMFDTMPLSFWKSKENQQLFFREYMKKHNITEIEGLYNISIEEISQETGGQQLLQLYGGDFITALMHAFPDYNWKYFKFKNIPNRFFGDKSKHRLYFEQLQEELRFNDLERWYSVTLHEISKWNGAQAILSHYGNSLQKTLRALFPEFPWDITKFSSVPDGYWNKEENVLDALNKLAAKLNIKSPEEWYGVSKSQWNAAGMNTLISKYGMIGLLSKYIKGHSFTPENKKLFLQSRSRLLIDGLLQELYPLLSENDYVYNYFHPKFSKATTPTVFDIFIEKEKLGFLIESKARKLDYEDIENKRTIGYSFGIKIVIIPNGWWGTKETLANLIDTEKTNLEIWRTNHLMNK